jgi:hypothetical protein
MKERYFLFQAKNTHTLCEIRDVHIKQDSLCPTVRTFLRSRMHIAEFLSMYAFQLLAHCTVRSLFAFVGAERAECVNHGVSGAAQNTP